MEKEKVIIVEDTFINAFLLESLLIGNYDVDIVSNAKDAYDLIEENNYRLVLLDIIMPEYSGFDLLKDLKENHVDTKVIVVSSLEDEYSKNKAFDLGAKFFISKPIDLNYAKKVIEESMIYQN